MRTILRLSSAASLGGRILRVNLPGSQARTLSPPGWMLVSNLDREYRIFNPLLRVSIELPALEKLHGLVGHSFGRQRIDRIALSSSTSSSRSYTVMVSISRDLGPPGLAFHKSGEDAWMVVSRVTHAPWPNVLQLIYHDGSFVALDARLRVMTLNESESRISHGIATSPRAEPRRLPVSHRTFGLVAGGLEDVGRREFSKLIWRRELRKRSRAWGTHRSLFLNDSSSFCMEFNAGSCLPGIKPNHVYLTDYVDEKKNRKSYSMDNGKVEICFDPTSRPYASQWFQPDF